MRLGTFLLPRERGRTAFAEAVLFPLAALGIAYLLAPRSLFDAGNAAWLWIVPLLIALRYGQGAGLGAAAVLIVGLVGIHAAESARQAWSFLPTVSGLVATLLAGQYSSLWATRVTGSELRVRYIEERLETLSRAFYVTRVSHDLLEENLITRPVSLRSMLDALRELLRREGGALGPQSALGLLRLLAQYCRIEAATLYATKGKQFQALASLDSTRPPLAKNDPLVLHALEHAGAAYYGIDELLLDKEQSRYRVVAPLKTSDGHLIGLLTVSEMPMLGLEEANLLTLAAILEYFADEPWSRHEAVGILTHYPDCPAPFARELTKLWGLWRNLDLQSSLLRLQLPADRAEEIAHLMEATRRGADLYWLRRDGDAISEIMVLLPFTSTIATQGYRQRLDTLMKDRLGDGTRALGCVISTSPLRGAGPFDTLKRLLGPTNAPV